MRGERREENADGEAVVKGSYGSAVRRIGRSAAHLHRNRNATSDHRCDLGFSPCSLGGVVGRKIPKEVLTESPESHNIITTEKSDASDLDRSRRTDGERGGV